MKKRILTLLIAIVALLPAEARRVRTGPIKAPKSTVSLPDSAKTSSDADTIQAPGRDMIKLSGYDKTLRAYRESFFVTNSLPDSLTLIAVELVLDYTDMTGRQLHHLEQTVRCFIPPGETRQLTIPAWDKQHTFYYYLSPAPKRAQGTPFKVKSTVKSAVVISGTAEQ